MVIDPDIWATTAGKPQVARCGLCVISTFRRQFSTNDATNGTIRRQHLDDIHGMHNDSYPGFPLLLANYDNIVELTTNTADTSRGDIVAKVNAMNWWLRNTAGSQLVSNVVPGSGRMDTNMLNAYTAVDGNGHRLPQYQAQRAYDMFYGPDGASRWQIAYFDNTNRRARSDPANWRLNGVNVNNNEAALMVEWRNGYVAWLTAMRGLAPWLELYGNPDVKQDDVMLTALSHPEYFEKLEGAFMETYINFDSTSAPDSAVGDATNPGGFTRVLSRMDSQLSNLRGPKRSTLNARGPLTDYKRMLYGLCTALMRDTTYFTYTDAAVSYASVPNFNEYDLPLGNPVAAMQSQGSFFRYREYDHCLAVVHMDNSLTTTHTFDFASVPNGPWRAAGSSDFTFANQNPSLNNGAALTSRSFTGKSGMIALRA